MLGITTVLLAGIILVVASALLFLSPGKPEPFLTDEGDRMPGSISEKIFIEIGGVTQGMFIRSKNIENPVLLYVHGGPAFPNYFLVDKYKPGLEDYFTVCYWEQRGGGLSYSPEVTLKSMNMEQFVQDAIELTNYLRERFCKEKIYMIAHSGGTPIGLIAASRKPELYHAYIAMAQITKQAESEKIAYKYMMDQYALSGKKKALEQLSKFPVLESDSSILPFFKSVARDQFMHELGIGTMHQMKSIIWDVFVPVWICKAYTLKEKVNIWKSKFSFLPKTNLIGELFSMDMANDIPKLDIPVYFISGRFDLTVNINLSRNYLKKLQAPVKGFYTFDNSAHSPLFEEPDRFRQFIEQDVLNLKTGLADRIE